MEALEAKFDGKGKLYGRKEFDKLLGHCQAVSDIPAILFAKELIEAYPEAKVILTYRNFDSWYKSCAESIDVALAHPINFGLMQPLVTVFRRHDRWTRPTLLKTWNILFKSNFKANARQVWDEHYALVKSLVPPERLLEYNVKDGWDPLVNFFDVQHPDVPFPTGNTTADTINRAESDLKQTFVECIGKMAKTGFWFWFVYMLYRRLLRAKVKDFHGLKAWTANLLLRP